MKYYYIAICVIILLLAGCIPEEIPEEPAQQTQPEEEQPTIEEPEQETQEEQIEEPEEELHYDDEEDVGAELEEGGAEEILPPQEKPELSEEEQIQQIFNYAKTKIKSYYYKHKGPSGKQYTLYVKENKIRIGTLSDDNKIYLDTEKKTAEEWCISYTKCGKEWGKIADLDYYDTYIETPIDWLDKITEAEKIDEGVYYTKQCWTLDTNIGKVTIDSNFGFIYKIEEGDKIYSFTDASLNTVKDSDVNVPEYLIEE